MTSQREAAQHIRDEALKLLREADAAGHALLVYILGMAARAAQEAVDGGQTIH